MSRLIDNDEDLGLVEFDGWPLIELKIQGDRYSSTMPSRLMRQISDIQFAVNRTYGSVVYNGDARNIKHFARADLELLYVVQKGSTAIKADATGFLNKLGEAMTTASTNKTASVTLCVLGLLIAGTLIGSQLIGSHTSIELEKLDLLDRAIEKAPEIKDAPVEFQRIFRDIIGSVVDADKITVGHCEIGATNIADISANQKHAGLRVDIAGRYKVNSIRRYAKYYLIEIALEDGAAVRAQVRLDQFSEKEIDSVLTSLTKAELVHLKITATKYADGYSRGKVTAIN